jgi:two-component system, chemotaxis family, chemotaxis protein CheY
MSQTSVPVKFDSIVEDLFALVIDDQRTMRGILRQLLNQIGVREIDEYSEGSAAWEFLVGGAAKIPDFILCDLHMVGMDGLEFVNKVRRSKNEVLRQIPVIVLTGDSDQLLHQVAGQVGAAKILQKPISAPDLKKEIAQIIGVAF